MAWLTNVARATLVIEYRVGRQDVVKTELSLLLIDPLGGGVLTFISCSSNDFHLFPFVRANRLS